MSRFEANSLFETLAEAAPFVDLGLLDLGCQNLTMEQRVRRLLSLEGYPDDQQNADLAACEGARDEIGLCGLLAQLSARHFLMVHGQPQLRPQLASRRLIRLLEPDLLVCFHPSLRPLVGDPLDWPAVPVGDNAATRRLLEPGSVETHIHLGGSLPSCYFWLPFMGGTLGMEYFSKLLNPERGHSPAETWLKAIRKAAWIRLWLALCLIDLKLDRTTGGFVQLNEVVIQRLREKFAEIGWPEIGESSFSSMELEAAELLDVREISGLWAGSFETQGQATPIMRAVPFFDPLGELCLDARFGLGWFAGLNKNERPPNGSTACCEACALNSSAEEGAVHLPCSCPGSSLGGCGFHYAVGERRLLLGVRALLEDRLVGGDPRRACIAKAFLAYLRVRNSFHRLLSHDEGGLGLYRFLETFSRRGSLYSGRRGFISKQVSSNRSGSPTGRSNPLPSRSTRRNRNFRSLLAIEGQRMRDSLSAQLNEPFGRIHTPSGTIYKPGQFRGPQRSIELRVALPDRGSALVHTVRSWLWGIQRYLRSLPPELGLVTRVGLVVHFLKKKPKDPSQDSALWISESSFEAAVRFLAFLRDRPRLRPFFVGIDAAGSERLTSPRLFIPAYRYLQQESNRIRSNGMPPIRLGYTFHVGEDSHDLLTGLRHIDETICLLLPPNDGGRLGHALALGDDPKDFYDKRKVVRVPLGCHLLDLVWAWGRLTEMGAGAQFNWLQKRLLKLLMKAASLDASSQANLMTAIETCYASMGLDRLDLSLEEADVPLYSDTHAYFQRLQEANSEKMLLEILLSNGVPKQLEPIEASEPWREMIWRLQEDLQQRCKQRAITIEANPTSNLVVGKYKDFEELPYRRLTEVPLPVSLSTDDPGLFMTSLPNEVSMLYESLRKKPDHRSALNWLDERLEDAHRSTFLNEPTPLLAENPDHDRDLLSGLFEVHG